LFDLSQFRGFSWDEGNTTKNWKNHSVTNEECEQVFFNQPLQIYFDQKHSLRENRYYVLGKTDSNRRLFIVFTTRKNLIRIISARDMTKAERRHYLG
jgi:hypothetical protein